MTEPKSSSLLHCSLLKSVIKTTCRKLEAAVQHAQHWSALVPLSEECLLFGGPEEMMKKEETGLSVSLEMHLGDSGIFSLQKRNFEEA